MIYDARLADQAAFVQAAGAVAMMHLEATQLQAQLRASTRELVASRLRLVEAADAERQRIERDLHDGVQQQIVALRIKLDMAAETLAEDPGRTERMLAAIGRQLDDLLVALRSFARGIYPSVLAERGLKDAIAAAARAAPIPVTITATEVGRYPEDIEVAIYFCCLEAIQNIIKHAGPNINASVRLWQLDNWLRFEVRDSGVGFDLDAARDGSGLVNMRDRIEAVGGTLWVITRPTKGTAVLGRVPIILAGASERRRT
jgi:signal transduction histidine kinase